MDEIKDTTKEIGDKGEELAKRFLIENGYTILKENYRFKQFEIDLIAQKNETVVFIEVKLRKNNTFGEPETFVSRQKQKFVIKAAQHFLETNNLEFESRFDIITITNQTKINHIQDAFYPTLK